MKIDENRFKIDDCEKSRFLKIHELTFYADQQVHKSTGCPRMRIVRISRFGSISEIQIAFWDEFTVFAIFAIFIDFHRNSIMISGWMWSLWNTICYWNFRTVTGQIKSYAKGIHELRASAHRNFRTQFHFREIIDFVLICDFHRFSSIFKSKFRNSMKIANAPENH